MGWAGGNSKLRIENSDFRVHIVYNRPVTSENRLPLIIFAGLVALLLIPLAWWQLREVLRPKLVGATIITATDHDPVFRDGPRRVPAGHRVRVAVALAVKRALRGTAWLAPVEELELGGRPVKHVSTASWPVRSRELRVFWFTVESTNVGGELRPEDGARRIRYRTFLAPEMGAGLMADAFPEAHNDDELGLPPENTPEGAGTLRFYARIEIFDPERGVQPLQSISTEAVDQLPGTSFPAVYRSVSCPAGIDPAVGELFLLPGFEPVTDPPEAWNDVVRPELGLGFTDLVERRLVVSSRTFAAVAVGGSPVLGDDRLQPLGPVSYTGGALTRGGAAIRWTEDAVPGDLVVDHGHWVVLLRDDGNGVVDAGDEVIHCWRRPPGKTTVAEVFEEGATQLQLMHHGT